MRNRLITINIFVLIIGMAMATMWWRTSNELAQLRSEVSRGQDRDIEKAAFGLEARRQGLPVEKLHRQFIAITMWFSDRRCVELRPRWGIAGGHAIYCFDTNKDALVSHEQVGE